ncbi:MAG: glycosyltransferase [Betaproteobacteria bacterium]|nr:glycosyltransferase [Betaproteobacteria bacterium]
MARTSRGCPLISIIIPTLNEERALPRTLAHVAAQRASHEVIVADGGSNDATPRIAREASAACIDAQRGRGAQMNAGARHAVAAKSEWLLFLHADTLLPPGALQAIAALPAAIEAGCFHQAFSDSGTHPLLKLVSRLHNWRCRKTHIMYGDQAMFVRRAVFNAVGGFPECELEDVKLSERLRERAAPVLLPLTVVTDARRFVAQGIVLSLARIVLLLLCHRYKLPLAGRRFFEPVR